ncbi:MAG: helix-turn-helix domain-containing protein [Bacteroidia bacterium]|nr:helix-turn-helix domain-containing protein [Bacteroidia bacterium]
MIDKEDFLKKLGQNIVKVRKSKSLSQTGLAHLCNKDPQSLERVENGKVNPTAYYLKTLADALNVNVKDFFEDIE